MREKLEEYERNKKSDDRKNSLKLLLESVTFEEERLSNLNDAFRKTISMVMYIQ